MNNFFAAGSVIVASLLALPAAASEQPKSLNERRMEVIKGTTEGRKVLDLDSSDKNEKSSPEVKTPTPGTESKSSTAAPTVPEQKSPLLSKVPPPSGRPLSAARRTEGAGIGIALPSAASASQAAQGK
jgi:hypothetical protein